MGVIATGELGRSGGTVRLMCVMGKRCRDASRRLGTPWKSPRNPPKAVAGCCTGARGPALVFGDLVKHPKRPRDGSGTTSRAGMLGFATDSRHPRVGYGVLRGSGNPPNSSLASSPSLRGCSTRPGRSPTALPKEMRR